MVSKAKANAAIDDMRHSLNIMYVLLNRNMPKKCGNKQIDKKIDATWKMVDEAVNCFQSAENTLRLALITQDQSETSEKNNKQQKEKNYD